MTDKEQHRRAGRGPMQLVGALVLTLALLLLSINGTWLGRNCSGLRAPHKGEKAPAFRLQTRAGQTVTLAALRGKVVVLDFWATWCPPCVAKYPTLETLQHEFGGRGLRVFAISLDRTLSRLDAFARRRAEALRKLGRPAASGPTVLVGRSSRVAADYGVNTLPHVTLVDRRGMLRYVHIGRGGVDELRAQVERALAEPPP